MMEFLQTLDAAAIVACVTALASLIAAIIALIEKIKAKNYKGALDSTNNVNTELMHVVDALKRVVEPAIRQPIMKELGKNLEAKSLKAGVDEKLRGLSLDPQS